MEYNNRISEDFIVWKEDGTSQCFNPGPIWLYYCDMSEVTGDVLTNYCLTVNDDMRPDMVNTVKENLKLFNHRQVLEAMAARQLQYSVGLMTRSILRMIDNNSMKNCPLNRESVNNTVSI